MPGLSLTLEKNGIIIIIIACVLLCPTHHSVFLLFDSTQITPLKINHKIHLAAI
jgi:hypothetical protein